MKEIFKKPVTALPNASQWLPPHVSGTSGDGADSSMHGVHPPTWGNRLSNGQGFSQRFLVRHEDCKGRPVRPWRKGEYQTSF